MPKHVSYWKLWEEFSTCLLRVIELEAMALLELPRGCDYWNDERMKCMINGTDSYIHDFDGCMYGLTTQFGDQRIPIKKPWRIVSWGVSPCYTHYYIIGWIGILDITNICVLSPHMICNMHCDVDCDVDSYMPGGGGILPTDIEASRWSNALHS